MEKSCAKCAFLTNCHEVTEDLLMENIGCKVFRLAEQGVLDARADIIRECGLRALRYEIPHNKKLSVKPKARRRRKHV